MATNPVETMRDDSFLLGLLYRATRARVELETVRGSLAEAAAAIFARAMRSSRRRHGGS